MVLSFPRPVVATSIISLFSVIIPVSAHVKTPLRPRAHAAAIQLRSFNDVDVDFARRANVPLEVRELNERGLLDVVGDTLNGGVSVVGDTVNGVNSVLGDAIGGTTQTTTTSNPPANPTPAPPATTGTQGTGGGSTANPANPASPPTTTAPNGSGNPATSNTQNGQNTRNNSPSATASNPSQQTSRAGSVSSTTGKALPRQPARILSDNHKHSCKWFYRSRSRWNGLAHSDFGSIVGRFRSTCSFSHQEADDQNYSGPQTQTVV